MKEEMFINTSEEYPRYLKMKENLKWITKRQEEIYKEFEKLMAFRSYIDLNQAERSQYEVLRKEFLAEFYAASVLNNEDHQNKLEVLADFLEENPNTSVKEEHIDELIKGITEYQ